MVADRAGSRWTRVGRIIATGGLSLVFERKRQIEAAAAETRASLDRQAESQKRLDEAITGYDETVRRLDRKLR